ncbi:olfactory protein-like [Anomaloglossus baeobatrachus]|uniref:olfactory protein-like n=1 Tax=Anomaloglossus baeobatrachus TaxID=238106 RepID=UPI003F504D87
MLQVTAAVLLLLCIQCRAGDVKEMANLDEHMFQGTWYGVIAASNCPMFSKMKEGMTMPIVCFAKDGTNMKNSVAFKGPDGCQQMDATMVTIASGHYTHTSVHGDNEVFILNTDYTAYALEYTKTIHEGQPCVTLKLYARKMELPEAVRKSFMDQLPHMGLKDEDAVVLPGKADCELKGY